MNKRLVLLSLISLLSLSGCGGSSTPPFDSATDYDIEVTSSPYEGVGYEIFTGAYFDGNGDGKGDFKGIEAKLPYIKDLGFRRIWLTPIHPSPSYHGYDVDDYYDVRSDFGTLEDFDSLVSKAHELGLEIIIDLVLNHTSSSHPWFLQSEDDYAMGYEGTDSKKDWYVWSTSNISGYNYSQTAGAYYECNFSSSMPELNLDNLEVRQEISNIASFWLEDHDIDGFRLDAVIWYYYRNETKNYEFLKWFGDLCKELKEDAYVVGEAWDNGQTYVNNYAANTDISYFNFPTSQKLMTSPAMLIQTETNAATYGSVMSDIITRFQNAAPNSYFSNFLTNHDIDRPYNYFSVKGERAMDYKKAVASMYLLTPGTPWVYYGEEVDLWGTRSGSENSDIARRLAMIWGEGDPRVNQLEPYDDSSRQTSSGANVMLKEPFSLTNHYKRVINLRNKYPNLFNMSAKYEAVELSEGLTGFKITDETNAVYYLIHSVSEETRTSEVPSNLEIIEDITTSTYYSKLENTTLTLPSFNSVLLR